MKPHIASFTRYKHIGNKVHAYEVTAYYDNVRRRPAQKSRHLEQLDPLTAIITRPGKIRTTQEKVILGEEKGFHDDLIAYLLP